MRPSPQADLDVAQHASRIVIERCTPCVDHGQFAAKGVVGQQIDIEADVYADGHEQLAVDLLMWMPSAEECVRTRMRALGNDRWHATFVATACGLHRYAIEASIDRWGSLTSTLARKHEAGAPLKLELREGIERIAAAIRRQDIDLQSRVAAKALFSRLRDCGLDQAVELLLERTTGELMRRVQDREFAVRLAPALALDIERRSAGFASWYELFPRSQAGVDEPPRHGNFDDVIARLPQIHAMGFDVLYMPPIHPIGRIHRKGRNNHPRAEPGEPGSPYAIGSLEGGHEAVHPELGGIEGFRRLHAAAASYGIELALDFAIQCSPDHPWLREHPGWFAWGPDGEMRYAENPPKRYEDIVNVDFYCESGRAELWQALRDVVETWIAEGVRTFRVDNPHTKPLPFWTWLIADVRRRHPDTIFLSEAFTRPAMMYRLAKIGFAQSYTYFTWRNSKRELTEYLTELTTQAPRDFFRPHFFVNTPDINPSFLHDAGRPGFLIRAALASTLSGLWGLYSGFELCEAAALPGKEEYLDSEKYELRPRHWNADGNIIAEITRLNHLRREHAALQTHLNLRFHHADNEQVLVYSKRVPDSAEMILVAVSLDPHQTQESWFDVPLTDSGSGANAVFDVEELMSGMKFAWHNRRQHWRFNPRERPFAIWCVRPQEA
ncbi:MAG: alpha-1,4-glucan--maltose-1-phosphate maltosyltransferase [Pseudomonadota bacterium]|nr:alpha-1,4-glucan--maltose-1-phosphate maltosyltransferase [Pseudomonadota bacterium]